MTPLLLSVWLATPAAGAGPPPPPAEAWRAAYEGLDARCGEMARDLASAREVLLERAAGDDAATARLREEDVVLRPAGYGVLPEILDNLPRSAVEPTEKRFSLETLPREFGPALEEAAGLAARARETDRPLPRLIDDFERLQEDLRTFEEHVGYHGYWQRAVREYPRFFEHNNEAVARVREIDAAARAGAPATETEARLREVVAGLAPFRVTPGLAIETREDGSRVLPVTLLTDIDDEVWLSEFRRAVEDEFADAQAARARRFRLELRLEHVSAAELYPAGAAPAPGAAIDAEAHLQRFPPKALVLTTGEESTHAWTGRGVVLGPSSIRRRTLAHEFAHLLGFTDAYLRGFDPASDPRFGVVFVEWTGLRDDLMGNVKGGRVTAEMIETLLQAYLASPGAGIYKSGEEKPTCRSSSASPTAKRSSASSGWATSVCRWRTPSTPRASRSWATTPIREKSQS